MLSEYFQLSVVLVEPQHPGNVGAVCRAMGNYGIGDLRLVRPCDIEHPDAVAMAAGNDYLLRQATQFEDLPSALADTHQSFAFTRRGGRLRGRINDAVDLTGQLTDLPPGSSVALVFGREKSGLTSDEILCCSQGVTVPTPGEKGSLNLAQAVVIALYELHRQPPVERSQQQTLPLQGEMEPMFLQMEGVLDRIGFVNQSCRAASVGRLRSLLQRSRPDASELSLLRGMWSQLEQSINDWPGRKRGEPKR